MACGIFKSFTFVCTVDIFVLQDYNTWLCNVSQSRVKQHTETNCVSRTLPNSEEYEIKEKLCAWCEVPAHQSIQFIAQGRTKGVKLLSRSVFPIIFSLQRIPC